MVGSRISLNVHGQNVPDRDFLLQHLVKLQPPAVLIMDAAGFARDVKAALPNTIVIHRSWGAKGDDDIHKQLNPEQWVKQKRKEVEKSDLWCYTTNEPEFISNASNEYRAWKHCTVQVSNTTTER